MLLQLYLLRRQIDNTLSETSVFVINKVLKRYQDVCYDLLTTTLSVTTIFVKNSSTLIDSFLVINHKVNS